MKESIRRIKESLATKKTVLNLRDCNISGEDEEIALLKQCQHLKKLAIGENFFFRDISFLEGLIQLEDLSLRDSAIAFEEFRILESLKKLKKLDLYHNRLVDISFLKNLHSLEVLNIGYNWIQDFSVLAHLSNLISLDISQNHERNLDLSFLKRLTKLEEFNVYNCDIEDISIFQELKNLKILDLTFNKIKDITALANCQKLECINLENTPITDISPLKSLGNLKEVKTDRLPYPPIWLVALKYYKGNSSDYTHLAELPQVEKIWQLFSSNHNDNQKLAQELAKGQGWSEDEIKIYQYFIP